MPLIQQNAVPNYVGSEAYVLWDPDNILQKMDHLNKHLDEHEPDTERGGALVGKYFQKEQRAKLWNAFKRKRDAASEQTRKSYSLLQARDRNNKDRMNVMALALFRGSNDRPWEEVLTEYTEKYEETHRKEGTKEWLTKGEIETRHGKKEARALMSSGYFETRETADGTVLFQKKTV